MKTSPLLSSEQDMIRFGESFSTELQPGDVVALTGDLGAGKTHFCKGVVSGLGSQDTVTSPTFSLVQEYQGGRSPVFHFDFYRLEKPEELLRIGWEEYLEEDGILLVEWAEKFADFLPEGARWLRFERQEDESRQIYES
jgi:tRNA threonylcarbamoyladenosine biosynthesis protein TsaE